ncbi:MAG: hypothetical protein AVDCRST_MAG31-471, partial [uncultured Sphingomonas sp.]
ADPGRPPRPAPGARGRAARHLRASGAARRHPGPRRGTAWPVPRPPAEFRSHRPADRRRRRAARAARRRQQRGSGAGLRQAGADAGATSRGDRAPGCAWESCL